VHLNQKRLLKSMMKPIHEAIQKTKKHHMHRDPCRLSNRRWSGADLKPRKRTKFGKASPSFGLNASITFLLSFSKEARFLFQILEKKNEKFN
jgi:hypothetical protein